jgi:hypothetical protein
VVECCRDVGGRRAFDRVALDPTQLPGVALRESLEDVSVCRKLVARRDDVRPVRPGAQHGVGELVDVDRGGIADQDLARLRANQLGRDHVADSHRVVEPVVPATDELTAPLVVDDACQPFGRGLGQSPQRVAVEIGEVLVVDHEAVAKVAQRVA